MDEPMISIDITTLKQWIWGLENGDPKEVVSIIRQVVDMVEHG